MSAFSSPSRRPVLILTDTYYFSGEIEPGPVFSAWLNEAHNYTLSLYQCTAQALDEKNALKSIQHEQVIIKRADILTLSPGKGFRLGIGQLGPHRSKLLVYLDRFVIQGMFQVPPDNEIDLYTFSPEIFISCTQAFIHPLQPTQARIMRNLPVTFINKHRIRFFHRART